MRLHNKYLSINMIDEQFVQFSLATSFLPLVLSHISNRVIKINIYMIMNFKKQEISKKSYHSLQTRALVQNVAKKTWNLRQHRSGK